MSESLEQHLAGVLGAAVTGKQRMTGGDICDAWRVTLADGRCVFAKELPGGGPMFDAEAFGLHWLAEANALRTPRVLHASPHALVLEFIEAGTRGSSFDATFGRGLARLHGHAPPNFGLPREGVIASLPQDNAAEPDWAVFYGARRLCPMLALCIETTRKVRSWTLVARREVEDGLEVRRAPSNAATSGQRRALRVESQTGRRSSP